MRWNVFPIVEDDISEHLRLPSPDEGELMAYTTAKYCDAESNLKKYIFKIKC